MSSIDRATIAETARDRLNLPPNDAPRLEALIDNALKSLGEKIAHRGDWEAWRKEIAVTCTSGIITLTDTSIIVGVLLETGELILNGKLAKSAPSYQDLILKMPADVYRWSLRGPTKIYVTDLTTGNLGVVTQTGTLAFNAWLTLTEMPDTYDKQLIDEVVLLAQGKAEPASAPSLTGSGGSPTLNVNTGG